MKSKRLFLSAVTLSISIIVPVANAGKLKNCDDVEEYAKEISKSMLKGRPKERWLHLYSPRYNVSNAIVNYVYSLKGLASSARISELTYRSCQSGSYGSFLSDKGSFEPHYNIGDPIPSRSKNTPEQSKKNQQIIEDLIDKMN